MPLGKTEVFFPRLRSIMVLLYTQQVFQHGKRERTHQLHSVVLYWRPSHCQTATSCSGVVRKHRNKIQCKKLSSSSLEPPMLELLVHYWNDWSLFQREASRQHKTGRNGAHNQIIRGSQLFFFCYRAGDG